MKEGGGDGDGGLSVCEISSIAEKSFCMAVTPTQKVNYFHNHLVLPNHALWLQCSHFPYLHAASEKLAAIPFCIVSPKYVCQRLPSENSATVDYVKPH